MYRSSSSSSSSSSSCSSSQRNMDPNPQLLASLMRYIKKHTKKQRSRLSSRVYCDLDAHALQLSPSLQIEAHVAQALEYLLMSSTSTLTLPAFSNTIHKLTSTHLSIFELITSHDGIHIPSTDRDRQQILDDNARLLDACHTLLGSIDDRYAYVQSLERALECMNSSNKSIVARKTAKIRVQNALAKAITSKEQLVGPSTHNLSKSCKSMLQSAGKKLEVLKLNDQLMTPDSHEYSVNNTSNVSTSGLVYGSQVATMLTLELLIASLAQALRIKCHKPQISGYQALWAAPLCALVKKFRNHGRGSSPVCRNKKIKDGSLLLELDLADFSIIHFLHILQQPVGSHSWQELQNLAHSTSARQRDILASLNLLRRQIQTLFTSLMNIRMKLL